MCSLRTSSSTIAALIAAAALAAASTACSRTGTRASSPSAGPPIAAAQATAPRDSAPRATFTKRVSFAVLEDYDKGEDLAGVARDFELMRELGVDSWRGSFGWDDYEPTRGEYDLAWLHKFADLAARHRIVLRPYLGYTAAWAGKRGSDGAAWNDPPTRVDDWYDFVYHLASEMRRHPNILSYEIYNEENVRLWWDGTAAEYNAVLARGSAAVRAADPRAQVLLGGMVYPDVEWIEAACETHGNARSFDVLPFHAYAETWTPESVTVENTLVAFRRQFLPAADAACGRKPIWINETGFATTPGKTERQQAAWWARAVATFAAEPRVEHIGIYEIKDLRKNSPVIGDAPNYHLGITRVTRKKKLAFHTLKMLVGLVGSDSLAVADGELDVTVTAGIPGRLYRHLLVRRDGAQVLFVWDRTGNPTLDLRLRRSGAAAREYALDGTSAPYAAFDGRTVRDVRLAPGAVRIFEITP